jgi:hypothetical protein
VLAAQTIRARVVSASISIIAVHRAKSTTHVGVTSVGGTQGAIVASDVYVDAVSKITKVAVAEIVINTVYASVLAAVDGVAGIIGAEIAIVTGHWVILAARDSIASVLGAGIVVIAVYAREAAAIRGKALVEGAGIVIIACDGIINTCSILAAVDGALAEVITVDGIVNAALGRVAALQSTRIAIITVQRVVVTPSRETTFKRRRRSTSIDGASISIIAGQREMLAARFDIAIVYRAHVIVIAVDLGMRTASQRSAGITSAGIVIIACESRVLAARSGRAAVRGAEVVVVA